MATTASTKERPFESDRANHQASGEAIGKRSSVVTPAATRLTKLPANRQASVSSPETDNRLDESAHEQKGLHLIKPELRRRIILSSRQEDQHLIKRCITR
ncbi:MAG: hypothetical protein CM15mP74_18520 [Halieaceae bacterium]|nr:MAG: hypothetical protein CM15mP74_18520 [Halieaceae bacterium]